MPRGPFPLSDEPLLCRHPSFLKGSADTSTERQPASITPVYREPCGMIQQLDGRDIRADSPYCNRFPALPIGIGGCDKLPGHSTSQGMPKITPSFRSTNELETGLPRLSRPQSNETQQPSPRMVASICRNSIPVAVPWTPSNNLTSPAHSLTMQPPENKLPNSPVFVHSGCSKLLPAVLTEKVQTEVADASHGPQKKKKLGLGDKPPVGLQTSCAFTYGSKEMNAVTATRAGELVPDKGLKAIGAMCARPGIAVPRGTRTRPSASHQGEHVAAKMYFHPSKLAWRSELLVDGCKRQRSFSCKLYGFDRARMMCEWSRNFVLRTARLPTEEETREAIGLLMGSQLQPSNTDEAFPHYTGWLYAYPPFETVPPCNLGVEGEPAPVETQSSPPDNHPPREHQDQYLPLKYIAGVCIDPQQRPQPAAAASLQVQFQTISAAHAGTGSADAGARRTDCTAARRIMVRPILLLDSSEATNSAKGGAISPTAEPAEGQVSPKQLPTNDEDVFAELGLLPMLKPRLRKRKRRKVGKKPHSGVRGMYIYQNAWKVNYFGKHGPITKYFSYSSGNISEMKNQHLLARTFLRRVIEKNRQIYDSDGEGLSEDEPVWADRVEKLSKLAQGSAAKLLDSYNPCCREPVFSPSQEEPTATAQSSSLLSSVMHNHWEGKATENPPKLQEGMQHANRISDSNGHQVHTVTHATLILKPNGPFLQAPQPGLPKSRLEDFMRCREASLCSIPSREAQPNQLKAQRPWPEQIGEEGGLSTHKGPSPLQSKEQDQRGIFSTSEGRELGNPFRRALLEVLPKMAACGDTCLNGPPKECTQHPDFSSSPPASSTGLSPCQSERAVDLRINPPNSALVFSGDNPEYNGCMQSCAQYRLGSLLCDTADKERFTRMNQAHPSSSRPSGLSCDSSHVWSSCCQSPFPCMCLVQPL